MVEKKPARLEPWTPRPAPETTGSQQIQAPSYQESLSLIKIVNQDGLHSLHVTTSAHRIAFLGRKSFNSFQQFIIDHFVCVTASLPWRHTYVQDTFSYGGYGSPPTNPTPMSRGVPGIAWTERKSCYQESQGFALALFVSWIWTIRNAVDHQTGRLAVDV